MNFLLKQMTFPAFALKKLSLPRFSMKSFMDFSKVNEADAFREEAHMKRLKNTLYY